MKRDRLLEVIDIVNQMINKKIEENKIENNDEDVIYVDITTEMIDYDLTDLGMDSITFIHIIVALEERFECEFPDEKLILAEMNTISKIVNVLKKTEALSTECKNSSG